MSAKPNELPIPTEVFGTSDPDEVCRVWIAEGESFVVFSLHFLTTPHQWGMVLADIAMHVANAMQIDSATNIESTLQELKKGYRGRLSEQFNISGRFLRSQH